MCWVDRWEPVKRHSFGPALREVPDVTLEVIYHKCPKVVLLFIFQNKIIVLCAPLLAVQGPVVLPLFGSGPLLDQFVEPRVGLQRDGGLAPCKDVSICKDELGSPWGEGLRWKTKVTSEQRCQPGEGEGPGWSHLWQPPAPGLLGPKISKMHVGACCPSGCLFRVLLQNSEDKTLNMASDPFVHSLIHSSPCPLVLTQQPRFSGLVDHPWPHSLCSSCTGRPAALGTCDNWRSSNSNNPSYVSSLPCR